MKTNGCMYGIRDGASKKSVTWRYLFRVFLNIIDEVNELTSGLGGATALLHTGATRARAAPCVAEGT